MSPLQHQLITEILTPAVQEQVAAALSAQRLAEFRVQDFTQIDSWTSMFGSTSGPYGGIGEAAMTTFRLVVISSEHSMVLFADDERRLVGRLYGLATCDRAAIDNRTLEAFTRS